MTMSILSQYQKLNRPVKYASLNVLKMHVCIKTYIQLPNNGTFYLRFLRWTDSQGTDGTVHRTNWYRTKDHQWLFRVLCLVIADLFNAILTLPWGGRGSFQTSDLHVMSVSHTKTWEQLIHALYNQEMAESISLELAPQEKVPWHMVLGGTYVTHQSSTSALGSHSHSIYFPHWLGVC